jgi:hypothetical protein
MPMNLSPEHYQGIGEVVVWFPGLPPDEISPFDFDAKSLKVSRKGLNRKSFKPAHFHKEALVIDRLAEDFKHFFSAHF